jgi:hypothetical protein
MWRENYIEDKTGGDVSEREESDREEGGEEVDRADRGDGGDRIEDRIETGSDGC